MNYKSLYFVFVQQSGDGYAFYGPLSLDDARVLVQQFIGEDSTKESAGVVSGSVFKEHEIAFMQADANWGTGNAMFCSIYDDVSTEEAYKLAGKAYTEDSEDDDDAYLVAAQQYPTFYNPAKNAVT